VREVDAVFVAKLRTWAGVRTEEVSNADAYVQQVDAFSAAIEGGSEFPATGEDGLRNQRILDALYRSERTHEAVDIAVMADKRG